MEFYLASSWIGKDDGGVIRTSKCFDPGGIRTRKDGAARGNDIASR